MRTSPSAATKSALAPNCCKIGAEASAPIMTIFVNASANMQNGARTVTPMTAKAGSPLVESMIAGRTAFKECKGSNPAPLEAIAPSRSST
jgi:hypothetical protein